MNREQINEWIVRYNEGSLKGSDLDEFMKLLAGDPELRRELQLDKEIDRVLQERDLLEFRVAILKAREGGSSGKLRWFLLAATLAVLVIGGGFVLYRSLFMAEPGKPLSTEVMTEATKGDTAMNETRTASHQDSVPVQKKKLLAGRFKPLASMENLVGEVTRADDIILRKPEFSLKIRTGETVTFAWTTGNNDPIEIRLFDNTGEKVQTIRTEGGSVCLLKTEDLAPGLYYWKLLKNDQLVTAGKIRMD